MPHRYRHSRTIVWLSSFRGSRRPRGAACLDRFVSFIMAGRCFLGVLLYIASLLAPAVSARALARSALVAALRFAVPLLAILAYHFARSILLSS